MTVTDKNQTPPFPNEPVVDKAGRVNRTWFYFFLQLFKKTEKLDDTALLLASGAYDTPKEYFKRIHTIEQGLAAIEQPRDYGKEISELRKMIEASPDGKSYSKDIDALLKSVVSEIYKPSKETPVLSSGTYTPTLTNVSNIDASTSFTAQYLRVGRVVTVSGLVNVDVTAAVLVLLGMSLPIPSRLDAAEQCAGVAFSPGVPGLGAAIVGDPASDRAEMQWIAIASGLSNEAYYYTYTYLIS